MKKINSLLYIVLLTSLVVACSQQEPFPNTPRGSEAITDVVFELTDKYPDVVIFSANSYSEYDKLLRIAVRFEGQIPSVDTQKKIIEGLLDDIAARAQEADWKPLFKDVEIDFIALSYDENSIKSREIQLATKEKNSTELKFIP